MIWSLAGLKIWKTKLQMKNITWHITPCHYLFTKTKSKMEKPRVIKLGHPMIQLPVGPLLAAITLSNHFLYDFISLSHRSGGILAHSSLQHCSNLLRFVGICLCTALTVAFQSGCGLDFDWTVATPWLFSFQPFCCRFAGVLCEHCPVAWTNFSPTLAVGWMASHLSSTLQ